MFKICTNAPQHVTSCTIVPIKYYQTQTHIALHSHIYCNSFEDPADIMQEFCGFCHFLGSKVNTE